MSIVIQGIVEHGDARGRLLGFPTANLRMPRGTEHDGVWAARAVVPGWGTWPATVSVGTRPTYYDADSDRLAEVHLLDFEGDLYGRHITVVLTDLLRGQVACTSTSELVDLIRDDVSRTRALLGQASGPGVAESGPAPDVPVGRAASAAATTGTTP